MPSTVHYDITAFEMTIYLIGRETTTTMACCLP